MTDAAALRADGFSKRFGRIQVLKSAGLWARPGRVTVLFGRNGSGKTTLFRCVLGLTRADTGVTHFGGRADPKPRLRILARRGLYYLPDRDALPRSMRFGAMVSAIEAVHGAHPDRDSVLKRLEVDGHSRRWGYELSGGEQRRCEWALALIRGARCLVADEPLAGVTPKDRHWITDALRSEADRGCAVLVTGHEARDLLDLGDEFIWMVAGTTHGLGSADETRANHQFRREYLGPVA